MKAKIEESIIQTLIDKYQVPEEAVSGDSVYDNLGLDSLVLLEISVALEKQFKLEIPDGVLQPEHSISKSVDAIAEANAEKCLSL
jgi:acyl carrier protein